MNLTPFGAYCLYLGIKNHFTTASYDFTKYGPSKAKQETFESRKDRWSFYKLSKRPDTLKWLVANFVDRPKLPWIGDLLADPESDKIALRWQGRAAAPAYHIAKQLDAIDFDVTNSILVREGGYPPLLKAVISGAVTYDVLVMLDNSLQFLEYWDARITDSVLWPDIHRKVQKTRPFVEYDADVVDAFLASRGWVA